MNNPALKISILLLLAPLSGLLLAGLERAGRDASPAPTEENVISTIINVNTNTLGGFSLEIRASELHAKIRKETLQRLRQEVRKSIHPGHDLNQKFAGKQSSAIVAGEPLSQGPQKTGTSDGAPGRSRTCDLSLRRRPLYPAELPGHGKAGIVPEYSLLWLSPVTETLVTRNTMQVATWQGVAENSGKRRIFE